MFIDTASVHMTSFLRLDNVQMSFERSMSLLIFFAFQLFYITVIYIRFYYYRYEYNSPITLLINSTYHTGNVL